MRRKRSGERGSIYTDRATLVGLVVTQMSTDSEAIHLGTHGTGIAYGKKERDGIGAYRTREV